VRLRYTLPALADLSAILDYIASHSPQSARRVQARIQALIYETTDTEIIIQAVRHAARDPSGMPGAA